MKKSGMFAMVGALALVLGACSGNAGSGASNGSGKDSNTKSSDYLKASYDDLKQGGDLTLALGELSSQQNPFQQDGTGYTTDVWKWYNPQLGLFDPDGTWHFNPEYFTNVEAKTENGKTVVTYDIKDEAKFNDGTPIDVKAFEVTWKGDNGEDENYLPSSTDGYEQIESVKAGTSPKQVVVTFKGAYPWWQGLFSVVLHPAIDSADKFNNAYLNNPHPEWGAGPYKISKYDSQGGVVTFVPNEKWWGPKAKLDSFTYRVMDSQASINAFKNGEIDATGVGSAERLAQVKGMEGVKIYKGVRPSSGILEANATFNALKDKQVRKAVLEGIDRAQLAKINFQGLDYTEDLPGSLLLFPFQPGYEDNFSKAVKFDPEAAKKGLEDAGYKDTNNDGFVDKDGKNLKVVFANFGDDPTSKNVSLAIQSQLKNIGVQLEIDSRPATEFSKTITTGDFDLIRMAFSSTDPFGVAYFGQIYASDGLNRTGTTWEPSDPRVKELQAIADPDDQIKKANELEVDAFKEYGLMPLSNGPDMAAVKDNIANLGALGFGIVPVENIGFVENK